jgi:hypothetical protein
MLTIFLWREIALPGNFRMHYLFFSILSIRFSWVWSGKKKGIEIGFPIIGLQPMEE